MMKSNYICVVSYNRPNNTTCNLLKETNLNWKVYIYEHDEHMFEYLSNYGEHVRIITKSEIPIANLSRKRQYALDEATCKGFDYCTMLDDDITNIQEVSKEDTSQLSNINIETAVQRLLELTQEHQEYTCVSARYNETGYTEDKNTIQPNRTVCANIIFDLKKLDTSKIKYNVESICEDIEITIDLLLNGYQCGRARYLQMNNVLGDYTNHPGGLDYKFGNTKFVEEGKYLEDYLKEKYNIKDVMEYDETKVKCNYDTLVAKNCLQN